MKNARRGTGNAPFPFVPLALRSGAVLLAVVLTGASSMRALAAQGDCGIPSSSGSVPKSSDCLFILKAGVGSLACAQCVCDVNSSGAILASDALLCLKKAVGQGVTLACPPCPVAGACPVAAEWTTLAGQGPPCSTNGDCAAGTCGAGRCRSATSLDLGWTGLGHEIDLDGGSTLKVKLDCPGSGGDCGSCAITGIDPSSGNCRCANDGRRNCTQPFAFDTAECPTCFAGAFVGNACTGNADCQAGPCTKRCANDPSVACAKNSDCPGSSCGSTTKCSNGKTCFVELDCTGTCTTGSPCNCYESPPVPLVAGGTPLCILPRLSSDVTGTLDPDHGSSLVSRKPAWITYLGIAVASPCPTCAGVCSNDAAASCTADDDCKGGTCALDAVAADGIRGGTCAGGVSDGLPCDVTAVNTSFPARSGTAGGAGYSLDCLPDVARNVSGAGVVVSQQEATGTSVLTSQVPCTDPGASGSCPCGLCSSDITAPCRSDADCAGQVGTCHLGLGVECDTNADCSDASAGPCSSATHHCNRAPGVACAGNADCLALELGPCDPSTCSGSTSASAATRPNDCTDSACSDAGGGSAACTTGPDDRYCDAVVTAAGRGVFACATNEDCAFQSSGIDGGNCTLVQRRSCFLDPIVAGGSAGPTGPVSSATFCFGTLSNSGKNAVLGLPGPVRLRRQASLATSCPGGTPYQPGVGGCP